MLLVDSSGLKNLQVRPPLLKYIECLFRQKHFILADARSKALKSGRGTLLGHLWILLNPILQVGLYAFVFKVVLDTSRGIPNFIGFLVIGVIFFGFMSRGISGGSNLIQGSKAMISSFSFPRASLAVSVTLRQFIDNLVPAIVAVVLALLTQPEEPVKWTVFLVLPIFALVHVFNLGCTLIVARLTAFIPDFKSLIQLFTRALFFVSGIFYSLDRFADSGVVRAIMSANPIYQVLEMCRSVVLYGEVPPMETWFYVGAWSFGLLFAGIVFFWQAEEKYNNVI